MNRPLEAAEQAALVVRSVAVVANPTAGGFRIRALERFAERLDALGIRTDVRLTRHAGHLTEIAATLGSSADVLVVGGGDGSINEAVQGLLATPSPRAALGVLPFGTANVLAHELGLEFDPARNAEAIAGGRTRPLHPGLVGDRAFLLMASAGFDADVVHAIRSETKRRWGKLAYAAVALRLALARQGRDVTVEADGTVTRCRIAVATTSRFYGGPMAITRHTDATRPGLRLVTLADDAPWTLAKAAVFLALGRLDRLAAASDRPVTSVRFSGPGIRMQVDGDRIETTDAPIRTDGRIVTIVG